MPSSDEDSAAGRWLALVSGRLDELQRLSPGAGPLDGAFWDRRADRYAANVTLAEAATDPFLRRLIRIVQPAGTAVDVGAGTGRYALPLAAGGTHVTAVDPSEAMLAKLGDEAGRRGIENIATVQGTWQEAETQAADVVFSSFVLTLVPDAPAFLRKLEATARRHVLLYLGAYTGDAVLDPLWRHFHGAPRAPGASYLDALAVLRELGIEPEVKIVEIPNRKRFATLEEAVGHYVDGLLLVDAPEVRDELEGLLATWLLGRRGAFRSPLRSYPAAIIHWTPASGP